MIAAQKERERQRARQIKAMQIESLSKSENIFDIVACIELLMCHSEDSEDSDDSDDSYWKY